MFRFARWWSVCLLTLTFVLSDQVQTANAHEEPELVAPSVVEAPPMTTPSALAQFAPARVVLEVTLDRAGTVTQAIALSIDPAGNDSPALIAAALDYLRKVRFSPALRGGQPVDASVRFEVLFPAVDQPEAPVSVRVPAADPAPDPPAHVHAHAHALLHSHAHQPSDAHEHVQSAPPRPELGALARITRPERSASSYTLELRDLPRGAHVLPADLARAVPGMFVIQHAGGGKANQYFLRGFDADHGTDIALTVDGVPVNMVSHGHGQGYADLNWLIPELVERVEVRKGPYDARDGDFATAGALDFQLMRRAPASRLTAEAGMFHSYRLLAIDTGELGGIALTGAAEFLGTDGPFERGEDLSRINLFARAAGRLGQGELTLTITGYLSGWRASGQIPLRSVRAGALDRFGFVDPNEGGSSSRHNLFAHYRSDPSADQRWDLLAYATLYRFALYSNFTFFRDDPLRGDMIRQRDQRTMSGLRLRYERDDALGGLSLTSRFGIELRHDRIDNGLARAPARSVSSTLVDARVDESAAAAYLEQEVEWVHWLRTTLAVRGDGFLFASDDRRVALESAPQTGEKFATRVSPKANLTVAPLSWLSVYGNFGLGFHSNDARGVIAGVTPLTRALGYEAGLSVRPWRALSIRAAVFRLELDSELVWVGDEGVTEASGATRREGIEADLRVDILPWLVADASLTLTRARFVDAPTGEDQVPLAPRRLVTAKLTARHPSGPFGRLSVIDLGDRPATEDGALRAAGFTRVDLSVGYTQPRFELALALENVLNSAWRESQFANVSRLSGENGADACTNGSRSALEGGVFLGCEDVHFTPGTPIAVRGSASLFF
jgi:outer membrane receptor protein involved in Fe transport